MFYVCRDIQNWNVAQVTDMNGLADGYCENVDISRWDVSKVTDFVSLFVVLLHIIRLLYSHTFNK